MELHEEVGPADTTIRAIAERAGVQRLTVYRHFPDERSLFGACSAHHASLHPMPSFDRWASINDPEERTRTALTEMYAYYSRTEPMLTRIVRDVSRVPALAETFDAALAELRRGREILIDAWTVDDELRSTLSAAIGHALEFQTWQSLARHQGLGNDDAVAMMVSLIRGIARNPATSP